MYSSNLEIHIALSLLPYLDIADIYRASRVNKHWNELFSSSDLLRSALRIYGSASREHQIVTRIEKEADQPDSSSSSKSLLEFLDFRALFKSFSHRTHNLRNGTPIQELRFQVRRAATTTNYVYAIADDVLVYLSPAVGHLSVIFWNHDTSEYACMQIELGSNNQGLTPSSWSVRRLKVFEDILVVEHTKEVKLENASGSSFWGIVQCFRLTSPFGPPGEDGERPVAGYEELSVFDTFKFRYVNYTDGIISDHSRTHYAAVAVRTNSLGVGLYVWNILTGKIVFYHEQESLGSRGLAPSPLVAVDKVIMIEDSHVLLIKPDIRNNLKWKKAPYESTGFQVSILTFALSVGIANDAGVVIPGCDDYIQSFVSREKDDEMLLSYQDYIQWRVVRQRAPKLHHHDNPRQAIYLNLWGRKRVQKFGKEAMEEDDEEWSRRPIERSEIHQYELTTDPPLPEGELPIRAVYTTINENLLSWCPPQDSTIPRPITSEISAASDSPFFLNSNGTDALSFDMVWSGGSSECLGTRLMTFYFGIRSFQLTETSGVALRRGGPLQYHLDYSSYLKTPGSRGKKSNNQKNSSGVVREIPSVQRNVLAMAQSHRGMIIPIDVHGDERMSIYTEPLQANNISELVMCVWGSEKLREVK